MANGIPLWIRPTVLGCLILAAARAALGVIAVQFPMSKLLQSSQTVIVGEVTGVNPENGVVDVKVLDTPKGKIEGDRARIQIVKPREVLAAIAAGQPAIVFVSDPKVDASGLTALHLANTWLQGRPIPTAKGPAWRVEGLHLGRDAFPGRTAALARLVREVAAGKATLLDEVDQTYYRRGTRQVAKLEATKPLSLTAGDVNGDGKPDLMVDAAEGCRLFLAAADGYRDGGKAWCPWGGGAGQAAFGDVSGDGKADCLLGNTIWLNTGSGFAATKVVLDLPEKASGSTSLTASPLARALMDATGDGKADALILLPSGELRVFQNPGTTDGRWKQAAAPRMLWQGGTPPAAAVFGDWGDDGRPHILALWPDRMVRYAVAADGAPPTDYDGLTGTPTDRYRQALAQAAKGLRAVALDVNGDRRQDLLVIAEGGLLLLVNRGYGAFLSDPAITKTLVMRGPARLPADLTPATILTAADVQGDGLSELLILQEDGTLHEVANPPHPSAPARSSKP